MSRRLVAEGLGTALLLYIVVGSGIAAETLSTDPAVALFAHATAVGVGLGALIAMFQAVSGSHFNPAVTLAFWRSGAIDRLEVAGYVVSQVVGAAVGVMAANVSFSQDIVSISVTDRTGLGLFLAETIATFVLVLVILELVKAGRGNAVPAAVGAWVACAVFATSSTGFANPAVTIARAFTDTYTGIAPGSILAFVGAQLVGGLLAAAATVLLHNQPAPQHTST